MRHAVQVHDVTFSVMVVKEIKIKMKLHPVRLLALICLAIAGTASANTYVKLTAADHNVYGNANGQRTSVSLTASTTAGWNSYSEFLGAGARWVWTSTSNEAVYLYNEQTSLNEKLIDFADPVGHNYTFALGRCTTGGTLAQKGVTMSTAVGTYSNVVKMTFTNSCSDAGTTEAWFAPQVGVIKWTTTSLIGPTSFELKGGKVAGQTFGSEFLPALNIATSFTKNTVVLSNAIDQVGATINLTNTSSKSVSFHFAGGQEFEVSLLDAGAQLVNTWGANIRFVQGAHDVTIAAGHSLSFTGAVAVQRANGQALTAGNYTVRVEMIGTQTTTANVGPVRAESALRLN